MSSLSLPYVGMSGESMIVLLCVCVCVLMCTQTGYMRHLGPSIFIE